MPFRSYRTALAVLWCLAALGTQARAQAPDTTRSAFPWLGSLVTLGSAEDDRERVAQLLGQRGTEGYLIRSPSTRTAPLGAGGRPAWSVILPTIRTTWNSDIPYSLNDGAMWAGRGVTTAVTAGARARFGPISLVLAPEVTYHQNRDFQIIPDTTGLRSFFSSPWHRGQESADLPLRFGDAPFTLVNPGQSSLTVEAGPVAVGVATENQWWGPGIRNALVMSNNAGGIPHAFLRTRAPLRTRVGTFEGRLMAGALTESVFFDTLSGNDFRSLSGLALTYSPVWVPGLTAGFSRVVYAGVEGTGDLPGHALDVFGRVPEPEMTLTVHGDTVWFERPDQMLSLFARWVFPRDRLEVYAEWARRTPPVSFRDWLAAPNHGQAYTLGSQWATPVRGDLLRFQAELSYLEQSTTFRQRRQDMYYASRSVRQGYTQRGQVIGAAIGPGASSQWVAGDWLAGRWQAGVFAGRVRWENDAYYRVRTERFGRTGYDVGFLGHDVSVLGGLRGGVRLPWVDVSAELTRAKRFDYLFQNSSVTFTGEKAVDVHNTTLSLTLSTPAGPR